MSNANRESYFHIIYILFVNRYLESVNDNNLKRVVLRQMHYETGSLTILSIITFRHLRILNAQDADTINILLKAFKSAHFPLEITLSKNQFCIMISTSRLLKHISDVTLLNHDL